MSTGRLTLTNAVIGCADIEVSARFWAALGFTERWGERVSADLAATLYGPRRPVETLVISAPGSTVGWLRLVAAKGEMPTWRPHVEGRSLLEIHARDLDAAVSVATTAGARVVGRTDFTRGDRRNQEVRLMGPDGVEIGLAQSSATTSPTLLSRGRELSEITNILWFVESVDAAVLSLPEFEVFSDVTLDPWPPAHDFLSLPDPAPAIRTAFLGETGVPLMRLQLLQVTGQPLETNVNWPIRPGVFAVGCVDAASSTPTRVERAGGVRLEIWPGSERMAFGSGRPPV